MMTSKPKITVDIDENGNSTVSVENVVGSGCKKVTESIEAALGKTSEVKHTRDWSKSSVGAQRSVEQK